MASSSSKLEAFVERIQQQEVSALSGTAQAIAKMTDDSDEANFKALADLILQDPAMTMHVLKASNSAYRVRQGHTNTVSRAIVMLGFNVVRSICLSCSLLDGLMKKDPREQLTSEMSKSFHAAVQARYLAFNQGEQRTEEIFISALLDNFGEMIFWAYGGEDADKLEKALEEEAETKSREEIEEETLGFTLAELSKCLAEVWGLSSHVPTENEPGNEVAARRRKDIKTCHRLAKATQSGWDTEEVIDIMKELQEKTGLNWGSLKSTLYVAAKEAATTAASHGATAASEIIPIPDFGEERETDVTKIIEKEGKTVGNDDIKVLDPDPMVQLEFFQKISSFLEMESDITIVISTVVEGIRRGVGLDRVLFALMNEAGNHLSAKVCVGADEQLLLKNFAFDFMQDDGSVFSHIFETQKPLWVTLDKEIDPFLKLEDLQKVVGGVPFYIAPIIAADREIGVFYADMGMSDRELNEQTYQMFKQLVVQSSLALTQLELRGV